MSEENKFYSGTIEIEGVEYTICVHPNGYKKADKHPDFRITARINDEWQKVGALWPKVKS